MFWTETAICDPFFYRWHKHVDDLCADVPGPPAGSPTTSATFAPAGVSFGAGRSVVLCLSRDIPGADPPGFDFAAFARDELGAELDGNDAVLTTELADPLRALARAARGIPAVPAPSSRRPSASLHDTHLVHDPFMLLRAPRRTAATPRRDVTARASSSRTPRHAGDRRMWIELDKFRATLAPGANLARRARTRARRSSSARG